MLKRITLSIALIVTLTTSLLANGNQNTSSDNFHLIVAAYSAAAVALCSLIVSIIAVWMSGKASNLNKKMFKRQGIIDLHMAWRGINAIDVNAPIASDVVNGVNALDLTASLWNHDVVEKVVLYQSYWIPYKSLYESLKYSQSIPPGQNKKLCEMITKELDVAYANMASFEPVTQTKL